VGEGVRRFEVGDRVGVGWLGGVCGECEFCRSGRENLCGRAVFTGWDRDGGYGEFAVADENCVFAIPREYGDLDAAPLLCGGVIGFRALSMTGLREGRLGLWGFGASAHIILQVACGMGLEVYVFSRGRRHLEVASELGALWCGRPDETPPKPLHASIIFAPAGELIPRALSHLERGGVLVLAGIHMSPTPPIDYQLLYWERRIVSVANFTRRDAEGLLEAAVRFAVKTKYRVFALEEANEALLALKESRLDAAAVLKP